MNLLDQLDPLPSFMDDTWFGNLPPAKRHEKEWSEACKQADGEDWHPTETKHLYRNGKGQFKYTPPHPQDPDIPLPFIAYEEIAEIDHKAWARLAKSFPWPVAEAEPQTHAASQMEKNLWVRLDLGNAPGEGSLTITKADPDGWIPHKPGDPMAYKSSETKKA